MPVMPAAAPATSKVLRSAAVNRKRWAKIDPIAPPVMMIGPSAPNGPPVPIEIADDRGLRIATFEERLLWPERIADRKSVVSGKRGSVRVDGGGRRIIQKK